MFIRKIWKNGKAGGTQINADELNRIEQGVSDAHDLIAAGGGGGASAVSSVFGRTGAIAAQAGDYTATQIGAEPAGAAAAAQSAATTAAASDATSKANAAQAAAVQRANHTGTQTMSTISNAGTAATRNVGTGAGTVAAGDDGRLSDARTPLAHAASHASGGSDQISIAAGQVTSGTFPAARLGTGTPDGTKFLRDDGTFVTPAGTGAGVSTFNTRSGAVSLTKADVTGTGLAAADVSAVPTARTVAGKALSADVTLVKGDVGLGNVDNTADTAKTFSGSQITSGTIAPAQLGSNPTASAFLRGDGTFAPTDDVHRNVNGTTTFAWRALLAKASTGALVGITAIGDSKTLGVGTNAGGATVRGSSWPGRMHKQLTSRRRLAGVGSGWVPCCCGTSSGLNDTQWANSAWPASTTSKSQFFAASTGSSSTRTFTSLNTGTVVKALYLSNSAPFTIKVDGVIPTSGQVTVSAGSYDATTGTVTPGGTNALNQITVSALTDSTHVVLFSASAVNAYLVAATVAYPTGLQVNNGGISGSTTTDWVNNAGTIWYTAYNLSKLFPASDGYLISLGINDALGGLAVATFKSQYQTMISAYLGAGKAVAIVVPTPASTTAIPTATWTPYVTAMYELAVSNGIPLIDLGAVFANSQSQANTLGMMYDDRHENEAGYSVDGSAIAGMLGRAMDTGDPDTSASDTTKLDKDLTTASNAHSILWRTRITGTSSSADQNISQVDYQGVPTAWTNERGLQRFRMQDNLDAVVRILLKDSVISANPSGFQSVAFALMEILNEARTKQPWGVKWDGQPIHSGIFTNTVLYWKTGDPNPLTDTTGKFGYGQYAQEIPSYMQVVLTLGAADTVPSWAPTDGRTTIRRPA